MRRCPYCENPIELLAASCPYCLRPLTGPVPASLATADDQPAEPDEGGGELTLSAAAAQQVPRLLAEQKYIEAIALVREDTGCTLVDAKAYVDALRGPRQAGAVNCLVALAFLVMMVVFLLFAALKS